MDHTCRRKIEKKTRHGRGEEKQLHPDLVPLTGRGKCPSNIRTPIEPFELRGKRKNQSHVLESFRTGSLCEDVK